MRQQSSDKPVLILMAGLAGSGKTTLARKLGLSLCWPVVDKDKLKSNLLDLDLGMPEEKIGRIAYNLLFASVHDFLVDQRLSMIFDAPGHLPFILEEVNHLVQVSRATRKIILCTATKELRRTRLEERAASKLYHPFRIPMQTTEIDNDLESFKHLPSDKTVLDTETPLEECLRKALRYVLSDLQGSQ